MKIIRSNVYNTEGGDEPHFLPIHNYTTDYIIISMEESGLIGESAGNIHERFIWKMSILCSIMMKTFMMRIS